MEEKRLKVCAIKDKTAVVAPRITVFQEIPFI